MRKLKIPFLTQSNNIYPLFFTLVFIFILLQYSFNSLEALFYDFSIKLGTSSDRLNEFVLVTLDEESDQFLGEIYPYTYATHSRFLKRILKDSPEGLGYLVGLEQSMNEDEEKFRKRFIDLLTNYKNTGGIFRFGTDKDLFGEQLPPGKVAHLGHSLALINKDGTEFAKDNVTRRAIINVSGEDSFHLWFAKQLLDNKSKDHLDSAFYRGSYYSRKYDATFALFKYSANPSDFNSVKTIPFHRVVVGNYPDGFFKNKMVLVGPQYISNIGDYIKTPFSTNEARASKLNVHAQIIAALKDELTIYSVPEFFSDIIAIIMAIFLSFYISRVQPARGLLMTMSIILVTVVSAVVLLTVFNTWLQLSHIVLSIFVVYYIWVPFRAIGEYQRRFAFEEETRMLKKVDGLKQNFISLMSHDLKTPVAKISGIADILITQYNNSDKQTELLKNISIATGELNNFISSILDLTKVESREVQLNLENKDLNSIVENVLSDLRYEASIQEVILESELAPLYPIQIDQRLMQRVISNIIGNAIKYSGKGSKVMVTTYDDDEWVYLEVRDNGVGIASEDLEHIFDKFYRVKNEARMKIKGSGLGLYLVKYFIELHQGKITVSSELGKGTSFTIRLKNE